MTNLKVNEIFYSIQGEGLNTGLAFHFVRLAGCTSKYGCLSSGILCDTFFESGKEMTLDEIEGMLRSQSACNRILWTGGEPTDQLEADHIKYFKDRGYYQAIETSGIRRPPQGLDYITVSPKFAYHIIEREWKEIEIDELRVVLHPNLDISKWLSIKAKNYLLSPHFFGDKPDLDAIQWAISITKAWPQWRLSIQLHKILNIR